MYSSWNARAIGLNMSAADSINSAAQAGFAGVDLLVRDIAESGDDPLTLRHRMDNLGLRGGAWPLPVQWRSDEARYQKDIRQLPRYASLAATLGLFRTGTWVLPEIVPGLAWGENAVERLTATVAFHLDRLGEIARILSEHGSRLGLEIIGPITARSGTQPPFVIRYADLFTILSELHIRHSNVGVLLDGFHLFAAGEEVEAGFGWGVDRVVWVHLADAVNSERSSLRDQFRALPGETGLADCKRLLDRLARKGYEGPVTAEPLAECTSLQGLTPLNAARRTLASLRSVWPVPAEAEARCGGESSGLITP